MANGSISHPIALVERLITMSLNKIKLKGEYIKAIKITQRGIYIYSTLTYDKATCEPVVKGERFVYKDELATIPMAELNNYISSRPRVNIFPYKDSKGLRILSSFSQPIPLTSEEESEKVFDLAIYLTVRELFSVNSEAGEILKQNYNFKVKDLVNFDAKQLLLEYQVKSLEDEIVLALYTNGYTEGLHDTFTGILYGKLPNGKLEEIAVARDRVLAGTRVLDFANLGIRIETSYVNSTTGIMEKLVRAIRYSLPTLTPSLDKVEHFKDIKNYKKGIILTNNIMIADIISNIYYFDDLKKNSNPDVVATETTDILLMKNSLPSYSNPHLIIEGLRNLDANEEASNMPIEIVEREAINAGYPVIIATGLSSVSADLLQVADSSLVYIIDTFNNLSDVQRKIDGLAFDTRLIMSRIIGILDIQKTTFFKMNNTMRGLVNTNSVCLSHIHTTSTLKVDEKYENFNTFVLKILKETETHRVNINNKGIEVLGTENRSVKTDVSFNNILSLLSNLTEDDIYSQMLANSIVTIPVEIDDVTYKIIAYLNASTDITLIIKKVVTEVLEDLPIINIEDEGKLSFIVSGKSNYNLNDIVGTSVSHYLNLGENILLVDPDYSISDNSFDTDSINSIEILRTSNEQAIINIINTRKPSLLFIHKIKDQDTLLTALKACPLVKKVLISSKYSDIDDIQIQYFSNKILNGIKAYNKKNYIYADDKLEEKLGGE